MKKKNKLLIILLSIVSLLGVGSLLAHRIYKNHIEVEASELQRKLDEINVDFSVFESNRNDEGELAPFHVNCVAAVSGFNDNFTLDDVDKMYFEIEHINSDERFYYEVSSLYTEVEELKGIKYDFSAIYTKRGLLSKVGIEEAKFTIVFNEEINKTISFSETFKF